MPDHMIKICPVVPQQLRRELPSGLAYSQLAYSHQVRLTDPRIVDELWRRAMAQKVDTKDIIEDILWSAFFPNVSRDPVKMIQVCPKCGSKHIAEPTGGFPLHWECFDCHAEFNEPLWVQPKHGPWQTCPKCGSYNISPPNRKHSQTYFCYHCRGMFEKPVERPAIRHPRVSRNE